jgi:hypothetical protein
MIVQQQQVAHNTELPTCRGTGSAATVEIDGSTSLACARPCGQPAHAEAAINTPRARLANDEHLDAADERGPDAAPGGFDFGKLRHCRSLVNPPSNVKTRQRQVSRTINRARRAAYLTVSL